MSAPNGLIQPLDVQRVDKLLKRFQPPFEFLQFEAEHPGVRLVPDDLTGANVPIEHAQSVETEGEPESMLVFKQGPFIFFSLSEVLNHNHPAMPAIERVGIRKDFNRQDLPVFRLMQPLPPVRRAGLPLR